MDKLNKKINFIKFIELIHLIDLMKMTSPPKSSGFLKESPLLEFRLSLVGKFRFLFQSLQELVSEALFDATPQGMYLQAIDSSQIALIEIFLPQTWFDFYVCEIKHVELGLSVNSMVQVLKTLSLHDTLHGVWQGDVPSGTGLETLDLYVENETKTKSSTFSLPLLSLEINKMDLPEREATTVSFSSVEFAQICKNLSFLDSSVTLTVTPLTIEFQAFQELQKGKITLKTAPSSEEKRSESKIRLRLPSGKVLSGKNSLAPETVRIEFQEPTSLTFNLEYLKKFSKSYPLSSHVVLSLVPDTPMRVEYPLEEDGFLRFYLAPKICEE